MQPHARPNFELEFDVESEIDELQAHLSLDDRKIPERRDDNLLIATWNLTNFGEQRREQNHLQIMAEILKPFDIIAVQEIADDVTDLLKVRALLGDDWDCFYTDIAGNRERLGYLYRMDRTTPFGLSAELAMRGYERNRITIENVSEDFPGFNRNPFMLGFQSEKFEFTLVNVHLYWSNIGLRQLETKALGKWAEGRASKGFPPNNDIILIGDFNMPRVDPNDLIYRQLRRYGLRVPDHPTNFLGTNLAGDAFYDEILFFPGRTTEFAGRMGVVDFDNALFKGLWNRLEDDEEYNEAKKDFFKYIRYYIADHRPLWAEFKTK